jgi:hypothetical protein
MADATPHDRPATPNASGMVALWPMLAVGAGFAGLCLGVILGGRDVGHWASDQNLHHLEAVRQFVRQWPWPDLTDYPSATAPGWHLLLAAVVQSGYPESQLRLLAILPGLLALASVWRTGVQWASPAMAALASLPLAMSPYVLGGSCWITTDVPAIAGVGWAMGYLVNDRWGRAAVKTGGWSPRVLRAGVVACLTTTIRQPMAWLAVPVVWAAVNRRLRWGIAASLLPVVVLAFWIILWKGLIPPAYRDLHSRGWNLASVLTSLSLVAIWGGVLVAGCKDWRSTVRQVLGDRRFRIAMILLLLLWIAVPSDFDREGGRWGGPIWNLVRAAPAVFDRSIVLLPMAAAGVLVLGVLVRRAFAAGRGPQGYLLFMSLALLVIANAANSQAWQRYADPGLLLLLPLLLLCGGVPGEPLGRRRMGTALLALATMQATLCGLTILGPALGLGAGQAGG